MKIKFELNGKALLGLSLLSAGIAFGDFVTLVDAKGSGGVTVTSGISDSELIDAIGEKINEITPIGSVLFRMDSINPSTLYGGTWVRISGDASLRFGDGTDLDGLPKGDNNPLVPLKEHTHSASQVAHSHNKGTMNITGRFGDGFYGEKGGTSASGAFSRNSSTGSTKYTNEGWVSNGPLIDFNAKNAWSGNTNSVAPAITVIEEGVEDAKIDVRGQYITINVWKRTG